MQGAERNQDKPREPYWAVQGLEKETRKRESNVLAFTMQYQGGSGSAGQGQPLP